VQLQDATGIPAKDPVGDVTVYLSSSQSSAGSVTPSLVIPFGQTFATGNFSSTYGASTVTVSAQTSGYESATAQITTYLIDQPALVVAVTANPSSVLSSGQSNITAFVTYDGKTGAPGAIVQFASSNGGSFGPVQDQGNGYYVTQFTAPAVSQKLGCTITANASKTGYLLGQNSAQITVGASLPTSTNMVISVFSNNGHPVSGANVLSLAQPEGVAPLSGTTNINGQIDFNSVAIGNYTFQVSKQGYGTQTRIVETTGVQTNYPSIELYQNGAGFPLMTVIIIVVVVVVIIAAVLFLLYRMNAPEEHPQYAPRR